MAWAKVEWDSVEVVGLSFKITYVNLQGPNKPITKKNNINALKIPPIIQLNKYVIKTISVSWTAYRIPKMKNGKVAKKSFVSFQIIPFVFLPFSKKTFVVWQSNFIYKLNPSHFTQVFAQTKQ